MRNRVAKAVLLIGLALAAAAHVLTYVALGNPDWISFSLGLVVVSFLAAVFGLIVADIPRTKTPSGKLSVVAAVLVLYAIFTFIRLHQRMDGAWSMDEAGGKYVLEDRGNVIRTLSEQEYRTFEGLFFRTWS